MLCKTDLARRAAVLACLFALVVSGCGGSGEEDACANNADACQRVLFVGNSYTYFNGLPAVFGQLATSGGHAVETGMVAAAAQKLSDHVGSADADQTIANDHWDAVVLQEQSQTPAYGPWKEQFMFPAAQTLVGEIRAAGASPYLFMTHAYRNGSPDLGLQNYGAMQTAISDAYLDVGRRLKVPVAPVGMAWSDATATAGITDLWQDDGSHPTAGGTYLDACVFYATIFRKSPVGLTYTAGLPADYAAALQAAANRVVLGNPAAWGLA